jgi:magnesium and cobalt exporter, CNNM family
MTPSLALILISLVASAIFSGVEMAFISSNKLQLEVRGQKGGLIGRILGLFNERPARFIATLLVGNTLALVIFSYFMAKYLDPWLEGFTFLDGNEAMSLFIATIISTLIVLLAAEYLPKSLFLGNPNKMLQIFTLPLALVYVILFPLVYVITGISKGLINGLFNLEFSEQKPVFGLTDLDDYVKKIKEAPADEDLAEVDAQIFSRALEFKNLKVRDCMIPRTELKAVSEEESIEDLMKEFQNTGHSKIMVFRENIDNVIGYCHTSSLLTEPKMIKDIVKPITIVPESMEARDLMVSFTSESRSIALVVDEFGGTAGIVTLEDVMEEIVGDIQDEHDQLDLVEEKIDEKKYILSARLEIDYLNEKYGWKLPVGEYDTLGGLILSAFEDLPKANQMVDVSPFKFKVLSLDGTRIDKVQLYLS